MWTHNYIMYMYITFLCPVLAIFIASIVNKLQVFTVSNQILGSLERWNPMEKIDKCQASTLITQKKTTGLRNENILKYLIIISDAVDCWEGILKIFPKINSLLDYKQSLLFLNSLSSMKQKVCEWKNGPGKSEGFPMAILPLVFFLLHAWQTK